MIVENSEAARIVRSVTSTLAIENMYLDKEFIEELLLVAKGEKSSEELRQEVLAEYGRQ
ncbi:MAG: antitoxin VbhA family protein [Selenomonas sp.]|nr:antitoxin VbhA family protein [Selenomonas sp.]